ncbi:MAG: hypothetical protein EXS05_10835 [Planctomycetaceae bacterium]|nr:hypothetical protein [Planctomycetaceae bacterium]
MNHRRKIHDARLDDDGVAREEFRWNRSASGRRLIRVGCLALFILSGAVAAEEQDGDDLVEEALPQAREVGQVVIDEQNFDQWVYRGDAEATRRRFEALLRSRVDAAAQAGNLTEGQKEKLELAGRGDMRRFHERVEVLRLRFKSIRHDINAVQAFLQEIQPLQLAANGDPFGQGSLYARTLRRTLTADQAAEYARLDLERRRFRYQARIESVVAMLDNGLAFRDEQRQTIVTLLLENTSPPRQFGQYDQYVVLYQLQRIPDGKLEKILDPDQRQLLQRVMDRFQGIEPFLQQNGLLPDPADEEQAGTGDPRAAAENARKR